MSMVKGQMDLNSQCVDGWLGSEAAAGIGVQGVGFGPPRPLNPKP